MSGDYNQMVALFDYGFAVGQEQAALANDRAPYGADVGWEAVMDSPPMFDPLKES